MAGFFTFLFLLNLMAVFNIELPSVAYGDIVTILSIDGGGVKGIIPAVVLQHLEESLQKVSGDSNARITDYFDVVAGTSTGGLMTAMLTAPDPENAGRPLFTPEGIKEFYKKECPYIFYESFWTDISPSPKYDGVYLHNITRDLLKETRLEETLTNVVIPTFDMELLEPVMFSSFKTKKSPDLNALLSDIVLSTSAAPTYLPPYYFKNGDTEFNMIDGAAVAASPALVAITEVAEEVEDSQFLMLSLGTGVQKHTGAKAIIASDWSYLYWAYYLKNFTSYDMVNYYVTKVFQAQQTPENYLRIEEYNLPKDNDSLDNSTKANLDALEEIGSNLLNEPAVPNNIHPGTNAEALDRLAVRLYEIKQQRLAKRSLGRKGSRKVIKEMASWFA
ncbi:hypothetical protein L6164_003531 [Bauhinia variegata]|uniref:Uncharacterized protein n=1 Tax=Bauhinia variegata TaxID=167791 RepID=A0ACB9Q339_BAUVA|nr:hypothetical protein L6164_003531 [Bauhinia variegata]